MQVVKKETPSNLLEIPILMNRERYETLAQVYKDTDYQVMQDMGEHFILRVGEHCPAADDILERSGLLTAAFITPENPESLPLSDFENYQRCVAFERLIAQSGFSYMRGTGRGRLPPGSKENWPEENSFFIVGVDEQKALNLARSFRQNAFIMYEIGSVVRLVWCVDTQ